MLGTSEITNKMMQIQNKRRAPSKATLPRTSAVIDSEVVACKEDGTPDFRGLHSGNYTRRSCVWAFDLMDSMARIYGISIRRAKTKA